MKPSPVIITWKTHNKGLTNRNRNSIGSVIPVTAVATTPEISKPLMEARRSADAVCYMANAAAGRPKINVGILPCDKKAVAWGEIAKPLLNSS